MIVAAVEATWQHLAGKPLAKNAGPALGGKKGPPLAKNAGPGGQKKSGG